MPQRPQRPEGHQVIGGEDRIERQRPLGAAALRFDQFGDHAAAALEREVVFENLQAVRRNPAVGEGGLDAGAPFDGL